MSITVRAPAKVNLALIVGRPRDDGYHPLNTVYQAISLYDDVRVTEAEEWSVTVVPLGEVDVSGVPLDESNIVVRAGRALAEHHGIDLAAHDRDPEGHPGGRWPGRWQRRRRRHPGRPRPAVGPAHHRRRPARDRRPSSAATCRSRWSAAARTASGTASWSTPLTDHGSYWWVVVPHAEGLSTPAVYARVRPAPPRRPRRRPRHRSRRAGLRAGAHGDADGAVRCDAQRPRGAGAQPPS